MRERGYSFTILVAEFDLRVSKVRFHQGWDNHLETHAYRQDQVEVQ